MTKPKNLGGRPRKLGDHRVYSLRLPSELHGALLGFADRERRSLNDILVEVISGWWVARTGIEVRSRFPRKLKRS